MTSTTTETEERIKAVDILDADYELRMVDPATIKIAHAGRSQKRSYVNDERSLSRVKDFENAYAEGRDVPPWILEEISAIDGSKLLYMVDGNHRHTAWKNLNGSAPTEVPAFVITRTLSEHERAALTCQANSGGPLPMLEEEVDMHIADSLNEGVSVDNIVKHYPNVTKKRVQAIKRAGTTKEMLSDLGVVRRLKAELAGTHLTSAIRKIHEREDAEAARRLDTAIKHVNSGKLSQKEFSRAFGRCDTYEPAKRTKALAELDETLSAAERPKNKGGRAGHASLETLKSDLKRFVNRDDDELVRLVTDVHARQDAQTLITNLRRALEVTDA